IIYPNTINTLVAHGVRFTKPHKLSKDDKFVIQCTQHAETQTRQRLTNEFKLNFIGKKAKALIGMTSLEFDFSEHSTPHIKSFDLSSVVVEDYPERKDEVRFFASPTDQRISVTESQMLGSRLYLLPGAYNVQLNGTSMQVDLEAGQ